MTICVAVKVAEGLVLAADSASTLIGSYSTPQGQSQGVVQTFEYANKLAHIKDYPIGVLSWGTGSISDRSIQSLIMEWEHSYPDLKSNPNYTVKDVADGLLAFFKPKYESVYPDPKARPPLGLLVGGFSAGEFFADEYLFEFPSSSGWAPVRPDHPSGRPSFGANWYGQQDALIRLIKGYDIGAIEETSYP